MVDGTLIFAVSTADLDAAIAVLANLFPQKLYPIAWRILTAERERRDLKARKAEVRDQQLRSRSLPPRSAR